MVKKGYWSESFTAGEIETIKSSWSTLFLSKVADANPDDLKKVVKKECKKETSSIFMSFPKPENDKEDGWIGIEPEQFKNLFSIAQISVDERNTKVLLTLIERHKKLTFYADEDGLTDWSRTVNSFSDFLARDNRLKVMLFKVVEKIEEGDQLGILEIIKKIEAEEISEAISKYGLEKEEWEVLSKTFSIESFKNRIEETTALWNSEFQFVPQRLPVLLQTPEKEKLKIFGKKLTLVIQKLEQYWQESSGDKAWSKADALLLQINAVNICILYANSNITEEQIKKCYTRNKNDAVLLTIDIVKKQLNKKTIDMLTNFTYQVAARNVDMGTDTLELCANFPENKHEIAIKAISVCEGDIELAYALVKYNVSQHRWSNYKNLRKQALEKAKKDKFSSARSLVLEKNGYKAYIPEKSSPTVLVSGEATSCCMTPDYPDQGWLCMKGAMLEKNQAVFIIEKDGTIFSQSWIWIQDSGGKKGVCFDSIETVFKEEEQLKMIFSLTSEFASLLKKKLKLNLVWFGEQQIFDNDSQYFRRIKDFVYSSGLLTKKSEEELNEIFGKDDARKIVEIGSWSGYSDSMVMNGSVSAFST